MAGGGGGGQGFIYGTYLMNGDSLVDRLGVRYVFLIGGSKKVGYFGERAEADRVLKVPCKSSKYIVCSDHFITLHKTKFTTEIDTRADDLHLQF